MKTCWNKWLKAAAVRAGKPHVELNETIPRRAFLHGGG